MYMSSQALYIGKKMKFEIYELANRHFDKNRPFTFCHLTKKQLVLAVKHNFLEGNYVKGKSDNSFIVDIPPKGIYSSYITLKKGQALNGIFDKRGETLKEDPIKQIWAIPEEGQERVPAKSCEVIVYLIDDIYQIVSINGSPTLEPTPIHPNTLIRNQLKIGEEQEHGTNLTLEEFAVQLRKSMIWHEDKAQLMPEPK